MLRKVIMHIGGSTCMSTYPFEKVLSIIFYSSVWLLQNLVQWFPLEGGWSLLVFQVTSKVKVRLLVFIWSVARLLYYYLFVYFLLNLVQWLVIESRRSFWFSGHVVKDQTAICYSFLWLPCLVFTNLVQWLPLESRWSLLIFRSGDQRSRTTFVPNIVQ